MAGQKIQADVLRARMFGSFQLYYGGRPLTGEKTRDSYFTGLMQILLHNIPTGVSRDYLEEALFGDRDVENRHQALQTIVYKAKKKLRAMGLPEENYIFPKKGVYYWTPEIPVEEDAALFDASCRRAEECVDAEERLERYLEACYLYKGEFLSTYAAVLWAGAEARRYRMLFCKCVDNAVEMLRKKEDWRRLEELGRHAVKTAPFSDWENLVMEALSRLGRYDEAAKFYADTIDNYLKEQGAYPSAKFMETMEMLGNRMQHAPVMIDQIKRRLLEEKSDAPGGYQCSYPVFQGVCQIAARMAQRGGGRLIDPTPDPDDPKPVIPDGPELTDGFYLVEHEATLVDDPEKKVTKYAIADNAGYVLSNDYEKLLPGMVLAKDPQLTVNLEKGVDGYIFVKVKNTTSNLTVNIDTTNWTEVTDVALADGETLYCYKGAAQTGEDGTELNKVGVLKDNQVTVADTLTGEKNDDGNIEMGALDFTAYACQAEGFASPAAAYTACFINSGN